MDRGFALPLGDQVAVTPWFNLVHVLNPGAAFSFLSDAEGWQRHFLTVVGIVVSLVLAWLLRRGVGRRLEAVAYVGLIGGALGNVVDRLRIGAVVDYLDLHWGDMHWPAFNLADMFFVGSAGLLVLASCRPGEGAIKGGPGRHEVNPQAPPKDGPRKIMQTMNNRHLFRLAMLPVAALLVLGLASRVHAQVTIESAWARATVPNQSGTGAFMRLTAQKDVVLTGASSSVAGIVEVHEMWMDKGIMRMRAADRVPLRAGQTIELKSGGLHIMMMDLKQQIKAGDSVPLTLSFTAADGTVSAVQTKATAGFAPPTR